MPCGSGTALRSSSAGEPIAPAAATNARARTVIRRAVGWTPRASIATQASAATRSPSSVNACARARVTSVAPRSSAAGMVVTSIDCLALVGQPMPQ